MTPPDSTPPEQPAQPAPEPSEPSEADTSSGVGQSGYAAGRRDPDRALARHVQPRNANYPVKAGEEPQHEDPHTDDRFTGRGGAERPPRPDRS